MAGFRIAGFRMAGLRMVRVLRPESDTISALMSPQPSIAQYQITSELGERGAGAVYRAIDTNVNRDVPVKAPISAFALDFDRLVRFTREAQVLTHRRPLNCPNLAVIYGVKDGAIMMEVVDARLKTGGQGPGARSQGGLGLALLAPVPGRAG